MTEEGRAYPQEGSRSKESQHTIWINLIDKLDISIFNINITFIKSTVK